MKAKDFIDKHISNYCVVEWVIPSTYITPYIILKTEFFNTFDERNEFLTSHSTWLNKIPFVQKVYYVGSKGCE